MSASGSVQIACDVHLCKPLLAEVPNLLSRLGVMSATLVRYRHPDAEQLINLFSDPLVSLEAILDAAEGLAPSYIDAVHGVDISDIVPLVSDYQTWSLECTSSVLLSQIHAEATLLPREIIGTFVPSVLSVHYGLNPCWVMTDAGVDEACLASMIVSFFGYGVIQDRQRAYQMLSRLPSVARAAKICEAAWRVRPRVMVSWDY